MNSSDVFNVILWGSGVAIFVVAKIRGRNGKPCLKTMYTGLAVLGAYGAIDCAARGETFMAVVVGLVALVAAFTAFEMRSKRKAREAAPQTDSE
ncbi:hypothetical protein [Pseudomonas veronii]|uniref:hypothetical protein n=1 Tax=Pseudomonas veronii TaxID=76761 RepID=UPI00190006F9|nr:hypothetical protein [Pseudomonas veronii]